jgi:hypothetical protein
MGDEKMDPCFSAEQARSLASLLDEIIPPSSDGKLPAAGGLGVIAYVESALQQMPVLKPPIVQGLSVLEEVAGRCKSERFASLAKRDRLEVLEELASVDAAFLPTLTFLAFVGYYRDGRIVEALGLEPRPPHPGGYEMPPNDFSLLDQVRKRAKLYRDV